MQRNKSLYHQNEQQINSEQQVIEAAKKEQQETFRSQIHIAKRDSTAFTRHVHRSALVTTVMGVA